MKDIKKYEYHPAADLFPLMIGDELKELANDIKKNGLLEPITMIDRAVLDGRNRLMACKSAEVEPRFVEWDGSGGSPTLYVIAKNLHRRHLTISQQATIGVAMLPLLQDEAKKRQESSRAKPGEQIGSKVPVNLQAPIVKGESTEIAGKALGVGSSTIWRAKKVKDTDPEAFERLKRGESTVSAEYRKVLGEPQSKRPSTATPQWTQMKQNAVKNKMERGFGLLEGACSGLLGLPIEHLRAACDKDEIQTWAKQARSISGKLCRFARNLENNGDEE